MALTKDDKNYISGEIKKEIKKEINPLRKEMNERFEGVDRRFENVNRRFDLIDERFQHLEDKIKLLPTSNEFLGWMDKIYTQLISRNQEFEFTKAQVHRNTRNIDKIEKDVIYLQKHALS